MHPEPSADPPRPRPSGSPPLVDGLRLTVAAAARRLGVAPSTLRTWDRRYGIGPTDHMPGRHRRYSVDDVARLELMQHALVRGAAPVEAARYALATRLPRPDVDRPLPVAGATTHPDPFPLGEPLLADADGPGEVAARVRVGGQVLRLSGAGRQARGLGRAALALDAMAARALLSESIAVMGIQATWDDVARPVLVAVAERWASTGAGVEIEHMLSECVVGEFGAAAAGYPTVARARPVLLAGMPGEQHMLPMVVLAATLARRGVLCRSLGADLPADALVAAVRRIAPVALVLWSQLAPSADPEVLRALPRTRPRVRVFVAGPGWAGVGLPAGAARLSSLGEATEVVGAAAGA
jgi:MerR family transcriptional regulator, light-induced transcriptional regulator